MVPNTVAAIQCRLLCQHVPHLGLLCGEVAKIVLLGSHNAGYPFGHLNAQALQHLYFAGIVGLKKEKRFVQVDAIHGNVV